MDFQYTKEAFKKDAVLLSEYVKIMDRGLCQIPDLSKELTDHDRTRIQFVLRIMKKEDLLTYSDEVEEIMLRIDPVVGPLEDFTEFLKRWRHGPATGLRYPQVSAISHLASSSPRLKSAPPLDNDLASLRLECDPEMGIHIPREKQARCKTPVSQFLDQFLMSTPASTCAALVDNHRKEVSPQDHQSEGNGVPLKRCRQLEEQLELPNSSLKGQQYKRRRTTDNPTGVLPNNQPRLETVNAATSWRSGESS
jgi:hypothetical protein